MELYQLPAAVNLASSFSIFNFSFTAPEEPKYLLLFTIQLSKQAI